MGLGFSDSVWVLATSQVYMGIKGAAGLMYIPGGPFVITFPSDVHAVSFLLGPMGTVGGKTSINGGTEFPLGPDPELKLATLNSNHQLVITSYWNASYSSDVPFTVDNINTVPLPPTVLLLGSGLLGLVGLRRFRKS